MKSRFLLATAALACATSAQASSLPNLKSVVAAVDTEYLSYGGSYGHRMTVNGRTQVDAGDTKLGFNVSEGIRTAGDDKFRATRLQATLVHDWNSRISTRTSTGIASSNPVFVNRELLQEISYKVLPTTVVTGGGKFARYYGGIDSWSWSLGASQYFRGGYVSYRFSRFDTEGLGRSTGHLLSMKLTDPLGASQLWVGRGTALDDAELLGVPQRGKYTSVELHRLVPIGGGASLRLGVKRAWYDRPNGSFHGTGVNIGITFDRAFADRDELSDNRETDGRSSSKGR